MELDMSDRQSKPRRRTVLRTASATVLTGISFTGTASAESPGERKSDGNSTNSKNNNSKPDLYIEGLDVDTKLKVESLDEAELALYSTDSKPNHDRIIGAINAGTAIGFIGESATKHLVGELQQRKPADVTTSVSRSSALDSDIEYSFGYLLSNNRSPISAIAYPCNDGCLDLHIRYSSKGSDSDAFGAALNDFETAVNVEQEGLTKDQQQWDDEFEKVHTIHTHTTNCSGGELYEVQECRINADNPQFLAWKYTDEMRPGNIDESECSPWTGRNNDDAYRRMEYHDGDLHSWGPDTTESESTVTVGISADGPSASWSYAIPDVVINNNTGSTNIVSWEHDVLDGLIEDTAFTSRPGVTVKYSAEPTMVEYDYDIEFTFDGPWRHSWTIEADGSGAAYIDY